MSVSQCVTTTTLPNGELISYTRLHMDATENSTMYHSTVRVPQRRLDSITYSENDRDFTYTRTSFQVTVDSLSQGLGSAGILVSVQAQNCEDYTQIDVYAGLQNADPSVIDYWLNLTVIGPAL